MMVVCVQSGPVSGTLVGKVTGTSGVATSASASATQGITTSHTTKIVPVTIASHQQQPIKQTIQVTLTYIYLWYQSGTWPIQNKYNHTVKGLLVDGEE